MQAIVFPNISPIAFSLYGFSFYWYSFAYIFGVILGYLLLKRLNDTNKVFSKVSLDDLIFYCVIGIIIGGRLGYCIFYDLNNVLINPTKILMIRNGGMSFHGGLTGIIIAIYLVCKKHKLSFLGATDLVSCVAPIGLGLGRIANFINAEMYGKVTDMTWGIVFPGAGWLPRHPTQIYEALTEGLGIIVVLLILFPKLYKQQGALSGVFLILYGVVRFIIEYFKEPIDGYVLFLTTGQALCLPMMALGIYLLILIRNRRNINDLHRA